MYKSPLNTINANKIISDNFLSYNKLKRRLIYIKTAREALTLEYKFIDPSSKEIPPSPEELTIRYNLNKLKSRIGR